jgi:hypothetical protein
MESFAQDNDGPVNDVDEQSSSELHVSATVLLIFLLLGSMAIYYIGWVYEASWYDYYGIDIAQLEMPLSSILAQGTLMLAINLGFLLMLFMLFYIVRLVVLSVRKFLFSDTLLNLKELFSIESFFKSKFHAIFLLYLGIVYWSLWMAWNYNHNTPGKPIVFLPGDLLIIIQFVIFPVTVFLIVIAWGDFLAKLPGPIKKRLRIKLNIGIKNGKYRSALTLLTFLATCILFSGIMGAGNASVGFRNDGQYAAFPRVNVVSDHAIPGLERFRVGCGCEPYTYGPLQYLATTRDYIILTRMKPEGQIYFTKFPEIYRIQRVLSNPVNIVPFDAQP